MSGYYERYSDPRATFVMIGVTVYNKYGRPEEPFHLRVTEEEFENMMAQSRRQYERQQWPPPAQGRRWQPPFKNFRPGNDSPYVDDDFGEPWHANYGENFNQRARYEDGQKAYEAYQAYMKAKAEKEKQADAEEKARQEREKAKKDREKYFDDFGNPTGTYQDEEPPTFNAHEFFNKGKKQYDHFYNKYQEDPTADKFFWDGEPVTEEEFNKRQAAKDAGSHKNADRAELIKRLGILAEVPVAEFTELKVLYNKARKKCHPDMPGGSHEKWIELEEIAHLLGIVLQKKPSRAR